MLSNKCFDDLQKYDIVDLQVEIELVEGAESLH